jgi:hypothetical protein
MTQLKWHDSPQESTGSKAAVNPWFGLSMALIGVIVGYLIGILY